MDLDYVRNGLRQGRAKAQDERMRAGEGGDAATGAGGSVFDDAQQGSEQVGALAG